MITQKLISLKIDQDLLDQVDDLCLSRNLKRKWLILFVLYEEEVFCF